MDEIMRELIAAIRARGYGEGFVISSPGGANYLAAVIGRDGKVCDPRNWDTHTSPESAIRDLLRLVQEEQA